ncbi:hypothetical protein jhhlp_003929 [Lomentospora prolificans]|uniref:Histone deacetylase domain-containing protein n=1 Tax=Lomentospora prolificans TaxID=41688 RepID=A0A2N3NA44_9PEZI|nr:hypothetical protein jhhlp_003929 [Lomentospora prolificans]
MLVLHHPATLDHCTIEILNGKVIPAYECPERISTILDFLRKEGRHELHDISNQDHRTEPRDDAGSELNGTAALTDRLIAETHDPGYVKYLRTVHSDWVRLGVIKEEESLLPECFRVPSVANTSTNRGPPRDVLALPGFYSFDLSSGISKGSWSSILASAELAVEAARACVRGPAPSSSALQKDVMALCRPPGHHCTTKMAGGYCYLNIAVIATHALRYFHAMSGNGQAGLPKIAILDLDFHHGNGTQDYFYRDPSVVYVSIHGKDEYPYYTGFGDETGEGAGEGANWNFPLMVHSSAKQYTNMVKQAMGIIEKAKPTYLVVSLGFDTYRMDPLGSFAIDTEDYETIARLVSEAPCLDGVPTVILLEGGYVLEALGPNLSSFLRGWESGRV